MRGFWGAVNPSWRPGWGRYNLWALEPRDVEVHAVAPDSHVTKTRFVFAIGGEIPTIGAGSSLPPSPPAMKMMHRSVTGANGEAVGGGDRGADIGLGLTDRVREGEAAGESRRDRRG